jgi:3-phenylpropionate/cinnamic acid dioxygenase small subunit
MHQPEADRLSRLLLLREIEDFLYDEAETIDRRDFGAWLEFFTSDVRYWMPIRKNLPFKHRKNDMTGERDIAWLDDTKEMMNTRVAQVMTGVHWAEEPLSRVSHLVTNIRLIGSFVDALGAECTVHSRFLVYRNRMETETDILVGRREDILRRIDSSFQICRRKIILDQATLTAKNLSFFI